MKFLGKNENGTSNEPINFGNDPWPWLRFALSERTLRVKVCSLLSASNYYYYLHENVIFLGALV